jgi:hypothetical protein
MTCASRIQGCAGACKPVQVPPWAFERIRAHASGSDRACAAQWRSSGGHLLASSHGQRTRLATGDRRLGHGTACTQRTSKSGLGPFPSLSLGCPLVTAYHPATGPRRTRPSNAPAGLRACLPKSKRYIYRSCSRIILLGCSPITILKTAPNCQFGGFFRLETPSAAF